MKLLFCLRVCVCVCSSLCDVPEFLAAMAAAADDGDIKQEMLWGDFIAIFHILCNRM